MNARTGSLPWDLSGRAKTPEEYKAWLEKRAAPRRACDERDLKNALADVEYLCTALRRIRSLEEKNVPKYAQQIAREALAKLPDSRTKP